MNAYFSAAKRGDVDTIARKIADPSLDLNAQDASGNTAVHYAAKFGHLDLVELLLGCGRPIEVSMLNKEGKTALNMAAENSHIEVYQLLLRCKQSAEGYESSPLASEAAASEQSAAKAGEAHKVAEMRTEVLELSSVRLKAESTEAQLQLVKQQMAEKQSSMAELMISHKELLARNTEDSRSQSSLLAAVQTRLEASQAQCAELEAKLRETRKEAALTASSLRELKAESAYIKERLKVAEEQLARKTDILTSQSNEASERRAEVAALKAEVAQLKLKTQEAGEELKLSSSVHEAKESEIASLKEREEVLVNELLATESKLELVEAKLHVKSKEWEDLKAETFIHKAKAEEEKIEREQAEANVARLTTELKELGARFASLTAVSADAATNSESLSNKLRVTEQLMNEETREKEMYKAELQSTLNKLGESQLEFTNRLAAKEAAVAEFEASVSEKMTTVKSLELALQARNDEIELLTLKMMKDEKLMADKEDTLKTLSRVKEHTEATVVELESKLAALSESSKAMKEEVEELKMTNVKLETAAKTAALDVADAKKETNIIALRGAEVEKEMASVQEELENTRSMMRAWSVSAEAEKKGLQDSLDGAHNTARKLTAQIEELTDDKQKREMDIQVLLEQTTVIEKELNEAIAWREAAEAKMAELGEYADTHEALTTQLAEAKALFAKMNTEISNLRVRVKMEEEENQQLQNKIQTLKLQLSSASSSSAAPSWA